MRFAVVLPWWGYVLAIGAALALGWIAYARVPIRLRATQRVGLSALRALTLGAETPAGAFALLEGGPVIELDREAVGWLIELAGGPRAQVEPTVDEEDDDDEAHGHGDHDHDHAH